MKTSCIAHPPNDPFYLIRADYMRICEGDACEAALLALFEFRTNGKIASEAADRRIYCTWDRLQYDLLGLYERKKIGRSLASLVKRGFLYKLDGQRGGDWQGRQTTYTLDVEAVQDAVMPVPKGTDPSPKRDHKPVPKGTPDYIKEVDLKEESKNARARPLPTQAYDPDELRYWLHENYPRHRLRAATLRQDLIEVCTSPEIEGRIRSGLAACKKSGEWQEGVIPGSSRWLRELMFDSPPPPPRRRELPSALEEMQGI